MESAIAAIGRETQGACESYKMTDQAGLTLGGFESLSIPCFDLPNQICLKSKWSAIRIASKCNSTMKPSLNTRKEAYLQ